MSQPRLDLVPGGERIALLRQPANSDKQMVAAATTRRVRWDQQLTSCECRLLASGLPCERDESRFTMHPEPSVAFIIAGMEARLVTVQAATRHTESMYR